MFRRTVLGTLALAAGLLVFVGTTAARGHHVEHYPAYFGAAKGAYSLPQHHVPQHVRR